MNINASLANAAGSGPTSSGFNVDVSRGERVGRVSSEWFSRPDDKRYLSLSDLIWRSPLARGSGDGADR